MERKNAKNARNTFLDGIHAPGQVVFSGRESGREKNAKGRFERSSSVKPRRKSRFGFLRAAIFILLALFVLAVVFLWLWFGLRDMAEHLMIGIGAKGNNVTDNSNNVADNGDSGRPSNADQGQRSSSTSPQVPPTLPTAIPSVPSLALLTLPPRRSTSSTVPVFQPAAPAFQSAIASVTPGFGGGVPPPRLSASFAQDDKDSITPIASLSASSSTFTILSPDPPLADCPDEND